MSIVRAMPNSRKQRGATNRFYLVLMSGLFVLFSWLFQRGNGLSTVSLMIGFGLLGMAVAVGWYIHMRSFRQLSFGKFKSLQELEEKLAYPFFKREWELLDEGKNPKKYWKLTVVETFAPSTCFSIFAALFLVGMYLLYTALR